MQLEKKEIFCIIKQIVINKCSFADARKTCLKKLQRLPELSRLFYYDGIKKTFSKLYWEKRQKERNFSNESQVGY
jgi:hypothetical protein